jgi:hypothetical protein
MPIYHVANQAQGSAFGTGIPVTTQTRTVMQLYHATSAIKVTEWGVSMNQTTAGTPVVCELIDTGVVGGTMIYAYTANDITLFTDPKANTPGLSLSTSQSGWFGTSEALGLGAPIRVGDVQNVAPSNQYIKQFPLGQEFTVPAGNYLRVRVTGFLGATPNAYAYVNFTIA